MKNRVIRFYSIGDVVFQYEGPQIKEKENLALFVRESTEPDYIFVLTEKTNIELPKMTCVDDAGYIHVYEEGQKRIRVMYNLAEKKIIMKDTCLDQKTHHVEYDPGQMKEIDTTIIIKIFDIPYQLLLKNGLFLHASYISWQESAVLFTAPKEGGKSTQAELWRQYKNAKIINGDRALLRKKDGIWKVYGSPFSGTSGICKCEENILNAIVILSKGKENILRKATTIESVIALMDGITYQPADRKQSIRVAELIDDLIKNSIIYQYTCLPNEEAVKILEESLCLKKMK